MSREIAFSRLFGRTFVCMKCNAKMRASLLKVKTGKVRCRKCKYNGLRLKSKESRG